MPKRITSAPDLSPEELQARFRQAKTTTQADHYQIIWLLAIGKTTAEVMAVTGYIAILNDFLRASILTYFGEIKFMFVSKKLKQKFDNLKRPTQIPILY